MKLKRPLLILTALLGVTIATSLAGNPSAKTKAEKTPAKQSSASAKVTSEDAIPGADVQPATYCYTGKPYDKDLGGYVFNYRTYSPNTSRWTAADPSGFPDGANSYSYVTNPLVTCDPLGLYKLSFANQTWTCSFSLAIYDPGNGAGRLMDEAKANKWKDAIISTWKHTGIDKSNGNPLQFTISIKGFVYRAYDQGVNVGALSSKYDFVASAAPGDFRSQVWNGNQGFWAVEASDLTIAHEAGHLMKARDFYTDVNGVSQPHDGWAHTLMGAAETPVTKDWNEVITRNDKTTKHLFE